MFESEHIYIEYSGSGHNIRVTYGKITQEEFDRHEKIRRETFTKNGYKEFEIFSKKDELPEDDFLLSLKKKAFNLLKNSDCDYYGYNIDTDEEFYE